MTDREQAIKTLEDIIATAEGIKGLSDDAGITISLDKIESLRFALESIKALDEIAVRLDLMISKYGRSAINGFEVAKKIVNEYRKEQE